MVGPLNGLKVLEMAGLGPAPFACMLLADLGADVIRVERHDAVSDAILGRGRTRVALNLKSTEDVNVALGLARHADILVEGFRPGVMERLGLGPDRLSSENPTLIYARMTGWGQTGPFSGIAGHDINYLGLTGALHAIGPADRPVPPLNLVADFGGGALYLVMGILAARHHLARTGKGQVIDCAMVDGASSLMAMAWDMRARGEWEDNRESNLLDGGAPFYRTYRTRDDKFMAVGSLEPQFFRLLVEGTGISEDYIASQNDPLCWPAMQADLERSFSSKSQNEWADIFAASDACVTPILALGDVLTHPHMKARKTIEVLSGIPQPMPAPRFSESSAVSRPTRRVSPEAALASWTSIL